MSLPYLTPLTPAELAAAGIPPEWRYGFADRVRFHEVDLLGHANNLAYLRWFETLRVDYLRDYGMTRLQQGDAGVVITNVTARYLSSLYLNDSYIVTGRTLSFRRTSFVMGFAVWAPGLCFDATAVLVQVAPGTTDKLPLSDAARTTFAERDGAVAEG